MNEEKIRRLIRLVEEANIDSLEIRPFLRTAIKITKTRANNSNGSASHETAALISVPPSSGAEPASVAVPSVPEPPVAPSRHVKITAPMVGTFYLAPAPDAPPFVDVGTVIKPGDTLCIIEAMKLMNEIEAEQGGRIIRIETENAQPVEFGQVLFTIDPAG